MASLLLWLQLETLPRDTPHETCVGHWWVAFDGTNPIGFAGMVQSIRWSDAGYMCRAGVVRSHRGKGLQKRLIRVRERKARQLGWNWLVTDTRGNPPSGNSLISCGFRLFTPSNPWGHEDAIYWRKAL
jgi:GNAT superfamily N-acetyltransferase